MKRIFLILLLLLVSNSVKAADITTTVCPGVGCVNYQVGGQGSIGIQIIGTWSGTITFQGTIDNVNYVSLRAVNVADTSSAGVTTTTSNGSWQATVAGLNQVRVVFTSFASGTASVFIRVTQSAAKLGGGGGGSGANALGTYLVQTATNAPANAQILASLSSGIMRVATTTGVVTSLGDILPTANGGTGIAFFTAAGPTVARVYTFPDAAATIARTDAAQTFTGSQTIAALVGPVTITEAVGSSDLTLTGATQTTSQPVINATQTWNAGGVTFTGIKLNVTNTASATTSNLIDLQVGASSVFQVQRSFVTNFSGSSASGNVYALDVENGLVTLNKGFNTWLLGTFNIGVVVPNNLFLGWSSTTNATGSVDSSVIRSSAGVVDFGNGNSCATATNCRDARLRHLVGGGSAPSVANVGANSCGTTAATIAGNDLSGEITVGATSGTQCRITFTAAAPTRWDCIFSDNTTGNIMRTGAVVDTTHADVLGAMVAGDIINYICVAR